MKKKLTSDEIQTLIYLGFSSGTIYNLRSRGGYKRRQQKEMLRLASIGWKLEKRMGRLNDNRSGKET